MQSLVAVQTGISHHTQQDVLKVSYGLPNVWVITRTETYQASQPRVEVVQMTTTLGIIQELIRKDVKQFVGDQNAGQDLENRDDSDTVWLCECYSNAAVVYDVRDSTLHQTVFNAMCFLSADAHQELVSICVAQYAACSPFDAEEGSMTSYGCLVRWETHGLFWPYLWHAWK
jgi:hypothetical protein